MRARRRLEADNVEDGLRAALAIHVERRYLGELPAGGAEGVAYLRGKQRPT